MWLTWVAILCVGVKAVPLPQTGTVSGTTINQQQGELDRNLQAFSNGHNVQNQASVSSGFLRENPNLNLVPSNQFQDAQGFFSPNQNINPAGLFSGQRATGSSELLHVVHPSLTGGVGSFEELGIGSAGFTANNDNFFNNADQNSIPANFRLGNSNADTNAFRSPGSFLEGFNNNAFSARTRVPENPGNNRQFFDQSNLGHSGFGIPNFGGNNFAIPQLNNAAFSPFGPVPILGTAFHPFGFNGAQFGPVAFPPAVFGNAGFSQNPQTQQPQVIVHSVPVVVSIFNDTHAKLSPHNQLNGLAESQRNQEGSSSFSASQLLKNAITTAETGSKGQADITSVQTTSSIIQSEGGEAAQEALSLPVESRTIINQSNGKNIDINSGGISSVNTGEAKVILGDPVPLSEVVETESTIAQENPALPAPKALFATTQSQELRDDTSNTNVIPDSSSMISSKNDVSHGAATVGESATVHPTFPKSNLTSLIKTSTHACALGTHVSRSPSTVTSVQEAVPATDFPGFPKENIIKGQDVQNQDILPIPEALASFAAIGTPPFASGISGGEEVTPLSRSGALEPNHNLTPTSNVQEHDITTLRPQNLQIIGTGISSTTPPTTFNTQTSQETFSQLGRTAIPTLHSQTTHTPNIRVQGTTPIPVLAPKISQVQDALLSDTTPQPTRQLQNAHITVPEVFRTTLTPSLPSQDTTSTTAGLSTTEMTSFSEGVANKTFTDSNLNKDSQPVIEQSSSQPFNSTSITELLVIPMNPLIAGSAKTLQEGQIIAETGTSVGKVMKIGEPVSVGPNIVQAQVEPFQSARSGLPKQSPQESVTRQHNDINTERTPQLTEQIQSLTQESHASSASSSTIAELSGLQETPNSSTSISEQLPASQPSILGSTISLSGPKEIPQQADLGETSTIDQSPLILVSTAPSQLLGSPATILGSPAFPVNTANDQASSSHLTPFVPTSNSVPVLANPPSSLIATTTQIDNSNSHQTEPGTTENFSANHQGLQPSQPIIIVENSPTAETASQMQQAVSFTSLGNTDAVVSSQISAQQLGTPDASSKHSMSAVGPVSSLENSSNQMHKTPNETTPAIPTSDTFQNNAKLLINSQNIGQITTALPNILPNDPGIDDILTSDTSVSSGITVKNLGSIGSGGSVTTQIPIILSSTSTVFPISQRENIINTDTLSSKVNDVGLRTEESNGIMLGQSAIVPPNFVQSGQQSQAEQDSLSFATILSSTLDVIDSSFANNQQTVSTSPVASENLQVGSNGQHLSARTSSPTFSVDQKTHLVVTDTPTSLTQQSTQLTNNAPSGNDENASNAASVKGSIIGQNIAQNPNLVLAIPLSLLSQSAGTQNNRENTQGPIKENGSPSTQNSNIFQNFSFTTDPNEVLKLVARAQAMTANAVGSASIRNNVFSSNNIINSAQGPTLNPTSIVTNNAQTNQQNSAVKQELQAEAQEQPTTTSGGTQFQRTFGNQQTPISLTINHQTNGAAGRPRVVSVVSPSGSLTFLPETVAKFSQALGFGVPLPPPPVVTLDKRQGAGTSTVADANKAQTSSKLGNTLKRELSQ